MTNKDRAPYCYEPPLVCPDETSGAAGWCIVLAALTLVVAILWAVIA